MNFMAWFCAVFTLFGILSGLIFIIFAKQLERAWADKYPSYTEKVIRVSGVVCLCLGLIMGVYTLITNDMDWSVNMFSGKSLFIILGGLSLIATLVCFIIGVGSNKTSNRARTVFNIVTVISLVLCVVFFTLGFTSSDESSTKDSYGNTETGVYVAVKDAVSDRLKSPSTAEFCPLSEATFSCSDNTWTVTGWVDAQNSFGATRRNDFTVVITFDGNNTYTIDSCSVN